MQIRVGKVAVIPMVLFALMTACTEKAADPQPQATAPTPVTEPVAEPVPARALSMRVTDARLKTGMSQNKSCNIEYANDTLFWPDQPTASRAKTVVISGWIIDESTKTVPTNLKLRLQTANAVSAWEQDVVTRTDRADVAKRYNEEAYLKAGFRVNLDIPDFAPGDYVVYLAFDTPAGEAICGIGRRFTVTP